LTEKEALIIVHKIVQGFFKGLKATEQSQGKSPENFNSRHA